MASNFGLERVSVDALKAHARNTRTRNAAARRARARKITMPDAIHKYLHKPTLIELEGRPPEWIIPFEWIARLAVADAGNGAAAHRDLVQGQRRLQEKRARTHDRARAGVVVLHEPSYSNEEFDREFGGQQLPLNPLEGLPGINPDLIKQLKPRGWTPDDHEFADAEAKQKERGKT
jgi:hypothetical protein